MPSMADETVLVVFMFLRNFSKIFLFWCSGALLVDYLLFAYYYCFDFCAVFAQLLPTVRRCRGMHLIFCYVRMAHFGSVPYGGINKPTVLIYISVAHFWKCATL